MADITHLPMEQLQDLEYCIDSNPPWRMLSLPLSVTAFLHLNVVSVIFRHTRREMSWWVHFFLSVCSLGVGFYHAGSKMGLWVSLCFCICSFG